MTGSRRLLPAATVVLAVLGVGALAAAAFAPSGAPVADPASSGEPTPRPIPSLGPTSVAPPGAADAPVAELADPAWVERIARASGIPERALAAYAGAALQTAATHPGCGIGWNTIAAIGFVESEHGTMGGSRIGPDGVASPAIIGIALDGQGVEAIPDTDRGGLDGDAVWDRAVGPMQFIPSSWALLGRDGDRDGEADVHDIDDAALAAAVHLCEVGGDLSQPANWIAAIDAYNGSVEYNNRVAEAASHYAMLT